MPPLVFKALGRENVLVSPFTVSKTFSLSYTSGSGNIDELNVVTALDFANLNGFDPNTAVENADGTFQGPLFKSVAHIFYSSGALSGSADFAAGGSGLRNFPLSGSVHVVNVPQQIFGEGIRNGSFVLRDANGLTTASIQDDGQGRLIVSASDSSSLAVVGNIFYDVGIAVINRISASFGNESISARGMYFPSGATANVTLQSTLTLYEYQIIATIAPFEFNYSMNRSAAGRCTSSGSSADTGSALVADVIASGTLSPYITTIGLYNDSYELVAVAKLPNPLKRLLRTPQSFIIRFDL